MSYGIHSLDRKQMDTTINETPRTTKSRGEGPGRKPLIRYTTKVMCRECLEQHPPEHYTTRNLVCRKCRGVVE